MTLDETGKYKIKLNLTTKNVGVFLSGGADSAIILYLICHHISKNDLDITISIARTVHHIRSWQEEYSNEVLNFIKGHFPNIKWGTIITDWATGSSQSEYLDSQSRSYKQLRVEYDNLVMYSGVTLNPPEALGKDIWKAIWKDRASNRDWERYDEWIPIENINGPNITSCSPFCLHDKRAVLAFYKKYDLLDSLLPITRTCEGWAEWTENYTKECKQCWWCIERNWAIADARGIKNWDAAKAGYANTYPLPMANPK